MTNPQKRKGSGAERAVVDYLREHGFPHAERRLAGSSKDRGDIAGVPGVVLEVKACERTELGAWMAEAEVERANDGARFGVVWHKRRGKGSAGDWYVTLTGEQFVALLRQAGYGTPAVDSFEDSADGTEPATQLAELVQDASAGPAGPLGHLGGRSAGLERMPPPTMAHYDEPRFDRPVETVRLP